MDDCINWRKYILEGDIVSIGYTPKPHHMFVPVPIQDLDFQHHVSSWYFSVFSDFRLELVVRYGSLNFVELLIIII